MGDKVYGSLLVGETVGLLEDCWFFGNTKMPVTFEETYESIEKLSVNNAATKGSSEGGIRRRRMSQELKNSAPASSSQPHFEEEEEEEMEFSMGKLIRQASLNHSPTNPPNKQGLITTSPMQHSGKKPEVDNPELEKTRPQLSQLRTQKSLGALQGCKDLGFEFGCKKSKSVGVSNPDFQEKLKREKIGERKLTRTQSWAPPVPVKWAGKRSKEDIKTQIKFWARAVASNVNPE